MSNFILGIDQGTTSTRACLMVCEGSTAGKLTQLSQKSHEQFHPKSDWVEHDAAEIWKNTHQLIEEVLKKDPHAKIIGIAIANQGETVVLWDRRSGQPLSRAIVWQDTRTKSEMETFAQDRALSQRLTDCTGLRFDAYFSASKIKWLLDHTPGARTLAEQGHVCAGTLDSWLIWNLTQGKSFVTDPSTAARTLLFNIHTLDYEPWILELFDIPRSVLPTVLSENFGITQGITGLSGVPILASLVDQPAALYGHQCWNAGDMKATFGTGCFVYLNTEQKVAQSSEGLLSTVAWRKTGVTTYALDGGIFAAGSVVNWLRDRLNLISDSSELDSLCNSVSDSGGVICVPALAGLAAPYWNRGARAGWFGMGLETERAHLVRAALEGVAFRVEQVIEAMQRDGGTKPKSLRVDGGLSSSAFLMQTQADLLGIPVEVCEEPEATLLGVCTFAADAIGLSVAVQSKAGISYHPKITSEERDTRLKLFAKAVQLTQDWTTK